MQEDDLTIGSERTLGVPNKPVSNQPVVASKSPAAWAPEGPQESVEEVSPSEPAGPLSLGPFGARYQILKLLGAGGMGAVYQAWDRTLSVVVALKVILTDPSGDPTVARDVERRFKRELLL